MEVTSNSQQRMLMTTDPFVEVSQVPVNNLHFDGLPLVAQVIYVVRNIFLWMLIILLYVAMAVLSTTIFAPISVFVHMVGEVGFWMIYLALGSDAAFALDDVFVVGAWFFIGTTSIGTFMYMFYGQCLSQVVESILLLSAQMQFLKLIIFTKVVGIECIEKRPQIYNLYHTAEGWFEEMNSHMEYHVILFAFRVFNIDHVMRMRYFFFFIRRLLLLVRRAKFHLLY